MTTAATTATATGSGFFLGSRERTVSARARAKGDLRATGRDGQGRARRQAHQGSFNQGTRRENRRRAHTAARHSKNIERKEEGFVPFSASSFPACLACLTLLSSRSPAPPALASPPPSPRLAPSRHSGAASSPFLRTAYRCTSLPRSLAVRYCCCYSCAARSSFPRCSSFREPPATALLWLYRGKKTKKGWEKGETARSKTRTKRTLGKDNREKRRGTSNDEEKRRNTTLSL